MKARLISVLLAALLFAGTAQAQLLTPDLGACLNVDGTLYLTDYAFSSDYQCDVWVYARNAATDQRVQTWLLQCIELGFTVRKTTVEGVNAYTVTDDTGLYAQALPNRDGAVMLLVESGMRYDPAERLAAGQPTATPVPQPAYDQQPVLAPTPTPAATPFVVDIPVPNLDPDPDPVIIPTPAAERWEWVEVEKDCPSCYNGTCTICNGSGVYRMYGESVPCRIFCSSCDGLGTYTTREYRRVY